MARFTRRAQAEEDLIDIWSYIAEDSPQAADRLLDKIDEACARLADHPRLGPISQKRSVISLLVDT